MWRQTNSNPMPLGPCAHSYFPGIIVSGVTSNLNHLQLSLFIAFPWSIAAPYLVKMLWSSFLQIYSSYSSRYQTFHVKVPPFIIISFHFIHFISQALPVGSLSLSYVRRYLHSPRMPTRTCTNISTLCHLAQLGLEPSMHQCYKNEWLQSVDSTVAFWCLSGGRADRGWARCYLCDRLCVSVHVSLNGSLVCQLSQLQPKWRQLSS